jgi:hypothetical protein
MRHKTSEKQKIVKFKGKEGTEASRRLAEIATIFKTSNRRTLQFCLAECFAIQSLPKPPRFYEETESISTIFIPFTPPGVVTLEFASKCLKNASFTHLAFEAIERVYENLSGARDFYDDSVFYNTYIKTIYREDVDIFGGQ